MVPVWNVAYDDVPLEVRDAQNNPIPPTPESIRVPDSVEHAIGQRYAHHSDSGTVHSRYCDPWLMALKCVISAVKHTSLAVAIDVQWARKKSNGTVITIAPQTALTGQQPTYRCTVAIKPDSGDHGCVWMYNIENVDVVTDNWFWDKVGNSLALACEEQPITENSFRVVLHDDLLDLQLHLGKCTQLKPKRENWEACDTEIYPSTGTTYMCMDFKYTAAYTGQENPSLCYLLRHDKEWSKEAKAVYGGRDGRWYRPMAS